jgi:hypothetical protein
MKITTSDINDCKIELFSNDESVAKIEIDNTSYCCENFGINIDTETNFVGLDIVDLVYDTQREVETRREDGFSDRYCNSAFYYFLTADGEKIKFEIYNEHNGYYSHNYSVKGFNINDNGDL